MSNSVSITFVLSISQTSNNVNTGTLKFNIVKPDGNFVSGERQTIGDCKVELDRAIVNWNRSHPDQLFIINVSPEM